MWPLGAWRSAWRSWCVGLRTGEQANHPQLPMDGLQLFGWCACWEPVMVVWLCFSREVPIEESENIVLCFPIVESFSWFSFCSCCWFVFLL